MNIILCGFKCAGKTTIGKQIANYYEQKFIDTDEIILERYRCEHANDLPFTISEVYCRLKEEQFRSLEQEVVEGICDVKNTIIALGGGAVLDEKNAQIVQELGAIIFLDVSPEILWERLCQNGFPAYFPMAREKEYFMRIYAERKIIYKTIANYVVTDVSIEGVLDLLGGFYGRE